MEVMRRQGEHEASVCVQAVKMQVKAIIEWDKEFEFSSASKLEATLLIENGETLNFNMSLDNPAKVSHYLRGIIVNGIGMTSDSGFKFVQETLGKREYKFWGIDLNDDYKFKEGCKDFHELHYIVTRGECVPNEKYCTFYGSSGAVWDTEKCNYAQGEYVERFIQTLYDMEHYNPRIYTWTNSPDAWKLAEKMKKDAEFSDFYGKNIRSVLIRIKNKASKEDLEELVEQLEKIPELKTLDFNGLLQKYESQHSHSNTAVV